MIRTCIGLLSVEKGDKRIDVVQKKKKNKDYLLKGGPELYKTRPTPNP